MRIEWLLATAAGVFLLIHFRDKIGLEDFFCSLGMKRKGGLPCDEPAPALPGETPTEPEPTTGPTQWPPGTTPPQVRTGPAPPPEPTEPTIESAGTNVPWAPMPSTYAIDAEFPGQWAIPADGDAGYAINHIPFRPGIHKYDDDPLPVGDLRPVWHERTFTTYFPTLWEDGLVTDVGGEDFKVLLEMIYAGSVIDFGHQRMGELLDDLRNRPDQLGTVGQVVKPNRVLWISLLPVAMAIDAEGLESSGLYNTFHDFVYRVYALDPVVVYQTLLYLFWNTYRVNDAEGASWATVSTAENLSTWKQRHG